MNGMEQTISKSYSQSAEEIDKLRKEAEEEKRKLERKIAEAEEEYSHNRNQ
jgi:ribosomal protein L18E